MNYRQRLAMYRSHLHAWMTRGAAAFQRARTQQVDMTMVKASLAQMFHRLRQLTRRERTLTLNDLRLWLHQHGKKLGLTVGVPVAAIGLLMVVSLQIATLSSSLALKAAQLNAIESLIQDSKNNANSAAAVPPLTDNDVETMRVILQNRGINPNILRLNLESGVGIEVQADQAAFGQWVAFLDEISRRWQIYPSQLTLRATDQPEIVSVRGSLQQSQAVSP